MNKICVGLGKDTDGSERNSTYGSERLLEGTWLILVLFDDPNQTEAPEAAKNVLALFTGVSKPFSRLRAVMLGDDNALFVVEYVALENPR